jgi:2-aminoadipate transaminase
MAKKLGVNRITIVNAYAELEIEGLVVSRVGSGTFVVGGHSPAGRGGETKLAPIPVGVWRDSLGLPKPANASQMITEMMRLTHQPGVISFAGGAPASEFLPVNEFRRALNEVLRRDGADALQYEQTGGYEPLRQAIADILSRQGILAHKDHILITTGCQQALDITLSMLTPHETNVVIVEDPCYLGLLDLLNTRHLTPVGLRVDEHGLRLDQLEQALVRYRPRLIHVTPTFHNPTGATMSLERRWALLDIAGRHGVPIVEDISYNELRYEGESLPTLKSLDTADLVFLAGGFSKILAPGIRIGFLVAPVYARDRLLAIKQTIDILTSPLNQRALHAYLQSGHFSEHLRQVRAAYRQRRDAMLAAVQQYLPAEAQWQIPLGGNYLWVNMPPNGPSATDLYLAAINYNVAFALGPVFSTSGSFTHALRLSFVTQPPAAIEEGIRRLGKAWRELVNRYTYTLPQPDRLPVHIL